MEFKIVGLIIAITAHLVAGQGIQRHMEFVNVLSDTQLQRQRNNPGLEYWIWRSEATELKVLRVEDPARRTSVNFRLCIEPNPTSNNVTIKVENIRYSNDGPSDTVYLTLAGTPLGQFNTFEKWGAGHEWNVFHNSGVIQNSTRVLRRGQYTLSVQAETDQWGIEYDRLTIDAENQNELVELICDSELVETIPRQPKPFLFL